MRFKAATWEKPDSEKAPPFSCKKHPHYKAVRAPKSGCRDCMLVWMDKRVDLLESVLTNHIKNPFVHDKDDKELLLRY